MVEFLHSVSDWLRLSNEATLLNYRALLIFEASGTISLEFKDPSNLCAIKLLERNFR